MTNIHFGKKLKKIISRIIIISAVFSVLSVSDISLASENSNEPVNFEIKKENLPADSPFLNPEPRIDSEAASIEKESKGEENYEILLQGKNHCASLPQNLWVLLLGAYIFLIIFNLSFRFEKTKHIRWFWESFYTILALLAWYNFDECRKNTWFAPSVIESGAIIYAFYFYFRNKFIKKTPPNAESPAEKQERLDLK